MGHTYKDSGVDVELGNDISTIWYEASRHTWDNRKGRLGEIKSPQNDFSGTRFYDVEGLPPGTVKGGGADGTGTIVEIAERLEDHEPVPSYLVAMVCDDAVVWGAEPVAMMTDFSTKGFRTGDQEHTEFVRQLAKGVIKYFAQAGVALLNGESAELGTRVGGYGPFNYNWCATVDWFANKDRIITGHKIKPGQSIVALKEYGFRANGLSLVRKIMKDEIGDDWHTTAEGAEYARQILNPATIYTRAVVDMTGGALGEPKADITGIAHITGGGIPEKLGRLLRKAGCGAALDNLWDPAIIIQTAQELGNVSMPEAYGAWNMGNGMLVITSEPDKVISVAQEHGLDARVAGETTKKTGIRLNDYQGGTLEYAA